MKVAIYSALYGDYEEPKPLPDLGVEAIMYTDNPDLQAPGWTVRHQLLMDADTPPMMLAKYWKCHPEVAMPDADVSLWLDASMTVLVDDYVQRCLDVLGDDDWVMAPHPDRTCVYDEADFSALLPRYEGARLHEQAEFYRGIGHPAKWGLFANGANVRRHTPAVAEVCEQWWWECQNRSWQDQVSLPVLVRLAGKRLRWNANMPWATWWSVGWH